MYDEVPKPMVTEAVKENPRLQPPSCSTASIRAMRAKPARTLPDRDQLERDTLRLLCSSSVKPGTRAEICRLLRPGVFLDAMRRAAFEEISAGGLIESRQLRATLPALVRGRGFPDTDLHRLLAPNPPGDEGITQLFASALCLLKLSGPAELTSLPCEADEQN